MSTVSVYDINRQKVRDIDIDDRIFNAEIKPSLFYDAVRRQLSSQRRGTSATKNRALVRGGGAKPWRQKGTGRARAGSRRSPLWRGGGTIFGPMPRDYSLSLPKKVIRKALWAALSHKLREGRLIILDDFPLDGFKTKGVMNVLNRFDVEDGLIVIGDGNLQLERSVRNIPGIKVLRYNNLNVYDILKYDYLIILTEALQKIQGTVSS